MLDRLKRLLSWPRSVSEPVWGVHSLRDNPPLTPEQLAYCVGVVDRIQQLYDGVTAYADRRGIDRALVLPGNEWADLVPVTGITFRKTTADLNYLRLLAPFAGYHTMFLDRLDERRFPEPWNEEYLRQAATFGLPDGFVDFLTARVDPVERLGPIVPEYRRHTRNVPPQYIVRTPRMFGEIGLLIDGVLANPDVTLCQSRINGMLSAGVLDKLLTDIAARGRVRVLEIGPGYGALGQALKGIFGDRLEYIAVDLPSSLYHSAIYLGALVDGEGCHLAMPGDRVPERFNFLFLANHLLDELGPAIGPIDLALNTMSFTEMSAAQVRFYAMLCRKLLRDDGVMFDENHANRPHHTDSKTILAEVFPFRKAVASEVVATKIGVQDVWSSREVKQIFDCGDRMLVR